MIKAYFHKRGQFKVVYPSGSTRIYKSFYQLLQHFSIVRAINDNGARAFEVRPIVSVAADNKT